MFGRLRAKPFDELVLVTTADQAAIGTSFANVTGLTCSIVRGGTYSFHFVILADSDATTTGIDVAVNGPASPTRLAYIQEPMNSTTAIRQSFAAAYDNDSAQANSAGATVAQYVVRGVVVNGVNAGTLAARIKRENVGSGPNVRAGSWGVIRRLA